MGLRGTFTVLLLTLAWVSPAAAEPRPYRGPHPVDHRGTWHDESGAHVHDDLPVGVAPFADVDGVMVFLADPLAYGYQGTAWAYTGAHPLPVTVGGYCGIRGVHRHPWAPEGRYRENGRGEFTFDGALRGGQRTHVPGRVEPTRAQARRVRDATRPADLGSGYGSATCVRYRDGDTIVQVGGCHGPGVYVSPRRERRGDRRGSTESAERPPDRPAARAAPRQRPARTQGMRHRRPPPTAPR